MLLLVVRRKYGGDVLKAPIMNGHPQYMTALVDLLILVEDVLVAQDTNYQKQTQ